MTIDLQSETVVSLTEAAKALPSIDGRRIHVSTLWRWARKGVRGVQLEYIRLGHRVCTSVEAVQRFAEALARSDVDRAAPMLRHQEGATTRRMKKRTPAQFQRDVASAENEIKKRGLG